MHRLLWIMQLLLFHVLTGASGTFMNPLRALLYGMPDRAGGYSIWKDSKMGKPLTIRESTPTAARQPMVMEYNVLQDIKDIIAFSDTDHKVSPVIHSVSERQLQKTTALFSRSLAKNISPPPLNFRYPEYAHGKSLKLKHTNDSPRLEQQTQQAISFESLRTFPKARSFPKLASKHDTVYRRENETEKTQRLTSISVENTLRVHSPTAVGSIDSLPFSERLSKPENNSSRQKISSEAAIPLNRVSSQRIDESASSPIKRLQIPENNNTFTRQRVSVHLTNVESSKKLAYNRLPTTNCSSANNASQDLKSWKDVVRAKKPNNGTRHSVEKFRRPFRMSFKNITRNVGNQTRPRQMFQYSKLRYSRLFPRLNGTRKMHRDVTNARMNATMSINETMPVTERSLTTVNGVPRTSEAEQLNEVQAIPVFAAQ